MEYTFSEMCGQKRSNWQVRMGVASTQHLASQQIGRTSIVLVGAALLIKREGILFVGNSGLSTPLTIYPQMLSQNSTSSQKRISYLVEIKLKIISTS